jgi:hypothetical protein
LEAQRVARDFSDQLLAGAGEIAQLLNWRPRTADTERRRPISRAGDRESQFACLRASPG